MHSSFTKNRRAGRTARAGHRSRQAHQQKRASPATGCAVAASHRSVEHVYVKHCGWGHPASISLLLASASALLLAPRKPGIAATTRRRMRAAVRRVPHLTEAS